MSTLSPSDISLLKSQDDQTVYKAHNHKGNISRNSKGGCTFCGGLGSRGEEREGSEALKYCSGCQRVKYCSADCQKQDWKRHKEFCKMHRAAASEAAKRHEASGASSEPSSDKPSPHVFQGMLEDFIQLHKRMLSVVVGNELARIRGSEVFPPMDVRTECVWFSLKLRGLDVSPASAFQYIDAALPWPLEGLPDNLRQQTTLYNARLHQDNNDPTNVQLGVSAVSAIFNAEGVAYTTKIEICRGHLDLNLLKRSVPENAQWWEQLEHNAQEGVVSRRFYDEHVNTFVEWSGILKQKENGTWRWERSKNETNKKQKAKLRDMKKASIE
ncbi:unnamed protein product [Peniophora sp. CBMAI 1063]|nr:unnamed protein product [Peniophora sp. CBMAI 1063]